MMTRHQTLSLVAALLLASCGNVGEVELSGLLLEGSAATEVTGTLTAIIAEDPFAGRFETHYELVEALGPEDEGLEPQRFSLDLGALPEESVAALRDGDVVTIRGTLQGDTLEVGSSDVVSSPAEALLVLSSAAPAAVEQRTLVIIANFSDATVRCSSTAVQSLMFGGAGSITDYYQTVSNGALLLTGDVVGPFTIAASNSSCDTSGWAAAANAAATAAGVSVSSYTRLVYVVPSGSCGYAGYGSLGGSPSRTWVLGYCDYKDVYAHELGHNLNMHHASTPTSEYGDISCIMGLGGYALRHLNGPHAVQMGWRTATQATTGSFDIAALALGAESSVLRVGIDASNAYYISFRDASAYDASLGSSYKYRTSVHTHSSGAAKTFLRAVLADGGRFEDPTLGLVISQVARAGSSARVEIAMQCVENAPTLALAPASRAGKPGDVLSYTLSLTNRDGQGCAARAFALDVSSPWPATLSSLSASLLPGATASIALDVAAPLELTSGAIDFVVSASAAGSVVASASGRASIDGVAPSAPSALTAVGDSRQVKLAWTGSSDDSGALSYRVWRDGSLIATVATTSYADRGANSKSTYTYEVDAIDGAGNASAKSAPASITAASKGGGSRRK